MAAKLDFRREFPDYYRPDPQPHLERFGVVPYLSLGGQGQPGGKEFQAAVQALFAVGYGAKFAAKAKGQDFTVPALEALWWLNGQRPSEAPGKWTWKLLLRLPATFTKDQLEAAKAAAVGRGVALAAEARLERIDEGDCVQALHVGPYAREPATIAKMEKHAEQLGLRLTGPHHEIYLNDPRKVPASKVKTLLRMPVAAA